MTEKDKDLGESDANISSYVASIAKNVADKASHAFHPPVEEYAQLFAHDARTGCLRE